MIRHLFILILWLLVVKVAWSIPANQSPFTVTNSDGTVLTIMLCGDECCHFYATLDGVPVVQEENGDWRQAPELTDSINRVWSEKSTRLNLHREQRAISNKTRRAFGYSTTYTGKKKGIVLLVEFPDLSMKSTSTHNKFEKRFNQTGYHEDDHEGSVHDYFYDQSYGQFDLTFDVYGPIQVSQGYAYYGGNDRNGEDQRVGVLTAEACRLADQKYDISWADYDWDGDKEVEQIFIIYAGYGEYAGASSNTIWPHESSLTLLKAHRDGEGPIKLGGQTIDTYAMSCELRGTNGSKMEGIGAACHEFTHCLGLPDFYDTKYSGGFGMQHWDIMASGSNNGPTGHGECPAGFTAYERWFAGWLNLIELNEPTTITDMPCLNDKPVAYVIYNDGNRNEYFLLENRQPKGWHQYNYYYTNMHGLLVTHVDYFRDAWVTNTVNSVKNHQRMSIIPAGNNYGSIYNKTYNITAEQYRSQLFPGNKHVTELTNDSHTECGGELFNRNTGGTKRMNKPITDIQESNGLISFKFMGGGEAMDIQDVINDVQSSITYYTLDGIPVEKPTQPGIYIEKKDGITRKVLL
jgi:M6 family metalloprotease-like protein